MSFVSRLIDPNPPLTSAQVQQAVAGALGAFDFSGLTLPSVVRSVQRGEIGIGDSESTKTATISSVTTSKTLLNVVSINGFGSPENGPATHYQGLKVELLGATSIRCRKDNNVEGGSVMYEVIEFA